MADAAEVQPLPDEEPIDETPQSDDSSEADQPGKDVSFGTFLTVGPKATRNVTIIGYDSLRNTVRAVRRSGDTVENIQIPYEQYKTLLDAQRESDLASGRKTKKNLSKAVSGYFGKSVALDGKSAQVIGYDAQSDEVLVSDSEGPRWMKSGEMLRSTQNLSRNPLAAGSASVSRAASKTASKEPRIIQDQGGEIDQDKTAQIQRAFEQGRITIQDPPGQRTVSLSVDTDGKVLRQLETTLSSIQPSRIEYVSPGGQSIALTDVDVAIPAVTAPLNIEATVETQVSIPGSSPTSIRATREALQQSRAASGAIAQGAVSAVAAVAATIPATNAGATAAITAAQSVLSAYANSAANRQSQIQELSNQISDVSNRINDLQQRSRQSLAAGDGGQAVVYEQQMIQAQNERRSLLDQQTDVQVTAINENNKAALIVGAVQQLVPDASGQIPEEKVLAVQRLLPRIPSPRVEGAGFEAASRALPTPQKVAPPRAYAPGIPTRPTASAANPAIRSPKPLRPLGGSLSTLGGQARRAADFNADQAYDRGAGQQEYDDSALSDSSEEALTTEGGLAPFSGPLDTPQAQTQTYAAGADDEEDEPADIYGAREEEGRSRMSEINQSLSTEPRSTERLDDYGAQNTVRESETISTPSEQPRPTAGPSQQELARAAAFQQATAQAVQQQGQQQQDQKNGQIAADQAESQKQKIQTAKKTFSNLVDAFDAVHGAADVIGILLTVAHLNIRLILTAFKRDLPFTPRAGYPYECGVILCFDIMFCLALLSTLMVTIVFIGAIVAAVTGATFGLSELVDLF
jgi:hypothetical protein